MATLEGVQVQVARRKSNASDEIAFSDGRRMLHIMCAFGGSVHNVGASYGFLFMSWWGTKLDGGTVVLVM